MIRMSRTWPVGKPDHLRSARTKAASSPLTFSTTSFLVAVCQRSSHMPFQCARGAYSKNEEPTLDELLAEPAVRLMMARDRVDEAEVRRIVVEIRERRGEISPAPAPDSRLAPWCLPKP
jgi:hypothetical protein